jgi:hypothetical protein
MDLLLVLLLAGLPFPAPKLAPANDAMKCDHAVVIAVDAGISQLRANTAAGLMVYKIPPQAQVLGADGRPSGTVSGLRAGQRIRVYYSVNDLVSDGAHVAEIDLD